MLAGLERQVTAQLRIRPQAASFSSYIRGRRNKEIRSCYLQEEAYLILETTIPVMLIQAILVFIVQRRTIARGKYINASTGYRRRWLNLRECFDYSNS